MDPDRVIDRYEQACQAEDGLGLRGFIESLDVRVSKELLEELVLIDLEYCWRGPRDVGQRRSAQVPRPRLDWYLAQFPMLGSADQLSPEFIAEEYLVRQCWGDHPSVLEYHRRFPSQWPRLRKELARLAPEFNSTLVKVYHRGQPAHTCELPLLLEIGRQQAKDPGPFSLRETHVGTRLVIAPYDEVRLSRQQMTCEPCGPSQARITCVSRKSPIQLPDGARLICGESKVASLPVLLCLGEYAIRLTR